MPRSDDGAGLVGAYVGVIAKTHENAMTQRKGPPMTAEINILIAAQGHQAELLAEADARRLTRRSDAPTPGSQPATRQRLNTLLRRLAGAPSFV